MRCIGLLGGMSYHSTVDYYTGINRAVAAALGGHHSAPLLLTSLDFAQVRGLQQAGDWDGAGALLADHAVRLERAGAEAVVICTNLMHKVAGAVEDALTVPLLHIVDAVAADARRRGLGSLGILGAAWTMTEPFYADRLAAGGVTPVRAGDADVALTDRIIFDELTRGVVTEASREAMRGGRWPARRRRRGGRPARLHGVAAAAGRDVEPAPGGRLHAGPRAGGSRVRPRRGPARRLTGAGQDAVAPAGATTR